MTSFLVALLCLFAKRPFAAPASMEDAASLVQVAVLAEDRLSVDQPSHPCDDAVQWNESREVVINNLGGLGPDEGVPPIIHIRNFVDITAGGRTADLIISNLTEYTPKNNQNNGLHGTFNSINMDSPSVVDLLFTFNDSLTGEAVIMPAFNLTIYDLDDPDSKKKNRNAERVSISNSDFNFYNTTLTTDVEVRPNDEPGRTVFRSSAPGDQGDNPTSVESLGIVENFAGDLVNQFDRAVAVQMHGNQSSYHIRLEVIPSSKFGRNFLFGLPAWFEKTCPPLPTLSPTVAPTPSPTVAPTAADVTTSFGDPHVSNLKGERFDILQSDYHTFLVIPRGSSEKEALLFLTAKVDPFGELCSGLLYVTSLRFTGLWVGDVGSLEFSTSLQGPMDAEQAITIKTGVSSSLKISEFKETIPQGLAEITQFQPMEPKDLNQHVDTLLVKLKLGPTIAKVRMVYQKEKFGYSNSLWLTTSGMRHVHHDVGGILGIDNHTFAASRPEKCLDVSEAVSSTLVGMRSYGSIHAAASFEDEESGES